MPTPEEYQKRLYRLVKLGNRLRVTQIVYKHHPSPNTFDIMTNIENEFDSLIQFENEFVIGQARDWDCGLPF